ncbi:thioesterase [Tautonia plasticadhaerens]|uniref:Uncharacterized protein n=1 Tax=Tautonia plasticadhaerens TaxID=2527974 RepID=A0A518HEG8_9BACT|nr:thioesterase [Tautonia plasticadhaerens]QDV39245.1 hypothetical protein ElP_72090 [Tautonia plasticadhaerens]
MARKSSRASQADTGTVSQDELEGTEPDTEGTDDGGLSKSEAIRRALSAGVESPSEGAQYVRDHFGIEVTPQHFSASKAQQKKRQEKGGAPKARRGRKPKVEPEGGYLAPPPKTQAVDSQPDLLAALEAMKPLVDNLGKAQVHRLVDLLG